MCSLNYCIFQFRRPSEPCIAEEEGEYVEVEYQRDNERVDSFNSEDTNELPDSEQAVDEEEDKAEKGVN